MGLFSKKERGGGIKKDTAQATNIALEGTRKSLLGRLKHVVMGGDENNERLLDRIEELLITTDVGVETTLALIAALEKKLKTRPLPRGATINTMLQDEMKRLLLQRAAPLPLRATSTPHVVLVVGVNGTGKTTSVAKLAHYYQKKDYKVVLGACDTFRAAAVEQLQHWGMQLQIPVVSRQKNADPASVAYETVKRAQAEQSEVVIIDTSGRLHNNVGLMRALKKIRQTLEKKTEGQAPHEVLLVLDGTSGQNAFAQTKIFHEFMALSGVVVTKLDGSSKGGMLIGVSHTFQLPIQYVGVGEQLDDLIPFDANVFTRSLFERHHTA